MRVETVIEQLRAAGGGSKRLDAMIAQAIGWRKIDNQVLDENTGEIRSRTLWLLPNSNDPGRLPLYTSNIEAAYHLVQQTKPSEVSGFAWHEGSASAQVGENSSRVTAATPALATCLATLMTFVAQRP